MVSKAAGVVVVIIFFILVGLCWISPWIRKRRRQLKGTNMSEAEALKRIATMQAQFPRELTSQRNARFIELSRAEAELGFPPTFVPPPYPPPAALRPEGRNLNTA
ncbi:hypothetical protein T439DRAFT_328428 [Meredithblackwellia eburnea MCA 4105]